MTKKVFILSVLMFSFLVPSVFAGEIGDAVEVSQKIQVKKAEYDIVITEVKKRVTGLTDKYISQNRETVLREKYSAINSRINSLELKYQTSRSIYKNITLGVLGDLEDFMDGEIERLEGNITLNEQQVQEKFQEVIASVDNDTLDKTAVRNDLIDSGITVKEAYLISTQTSLGDGFEFCANFPAEVYDNNALRYYSDAQSAVAREYTEFENTYYDNVYTDKYAARNSARILRCIQSMYSHYKNRGVTQEDIKEVYEKTFNREYKPFTIPFYLEGVQPEDIEEYIEAHHGW